MIFDTELLMLKNQIENAKDINELNYLRVTHEKKYWWTSIFISGLFYAINGKVGKMIITWIINLFTLGLYSFYIMYTSYKDQNEFNEKMEYYIYKRTEQLSRNNSTSDNINISFKCYECGHEVNSSLRFCPNCGVSIKQPNNYCSSCGEKIVGDAKFCSSCGNPIKK